MKRTVLTYGIIGGIIVSTLMIINISGEKTDWDTALWVGYTTMVIALSTIFFAVKAYRDKHLGGAIQFGKAFLMGLYITLVASTLYVANWMVYSSMTKTDYMAEFYVYKENELRSSDMPEAEVEAELNDLREFTALYNSNPAVKAGATYMEILPVGLLISLICAAILKRSDPVPTVRTSHR